MHWASPLGHAAVCVFLQLHATTCVCSAGQNYANTIQCFFQKKIQYVQLYNTVTGE